MPSGNAFHTRSSKDLHLLFQSFIQFQELTQTLPSVSQIQRIIFLLYSLDLRHLKVTSAAKLFFVMK